MVNEVNVVNNYTVRPCIKGTSKQDRTTLHTELRRPFQLVVEISPRLVDSGGGLHFFPLAPASLIPSFWTLPLMCRHGVNGCARGSQRAISVINPPLPPCLRQGLLFTAEYAGLAGPQASGEFLASVSHHST